MRSDDRQLWLGALLLVTVAMVGCGGTGTPGTDGTSAASAEPTTASEAPTPSGAVTVPESYCVDSYASDNIDSVAIWPSQGWVIATAKEGQRLLVLNIADGSLVREVTAPDQPFLRPNGIAVLGDHLLVVERDNHQVRVLSLPELKTLTTFGADTLRRPYGLAVFSADGFWELYVTDNYETPEETIPPPAELDERVHHFRVDPSTLSAELVRSFGATEGPGVLQTVESIVADVSGGRLLIADETANDYKVYGLDGQFLGETFGEGQFAHQSEGIALAACHDGGYWVATDQGDLETRFPLLDRGSGELAGAFVGHTVANTDGVALATSALPGFPGGALVAVHDDKGLCVIDWQQIVTATGIAWNCGE